MLTQADIAQLAPDPLQPSARVPARLFWPRYRLEDEGDGRDRHRTLMSYFALEPAR